jgi:hypothetical protein
MSQGDCWGSADDSELADQLKIDNTPAAMAWAAQHERGIETKLGENLPRWLEKDDRPVLKAQDARRVGSVAGDHLRGDLAPGRGRRRRSGGRECLAAIGALPDGDPSGGGLGQPQRRGAACCARHGGRCLCLSLGGARLRDEAISLRHGCDA